MTLAPSSGGFLMNWSCTASCVASTRDDAERPRGDAHLVAFEQRARRLGQLAEAVDQLLAQQVELLARLGVGQALVERQALVHVAAVARRQQRGHVQVHFGGDVERPPISGALPAFSLRTARSSMRA